MPTMQAVPSFPKLSQLWALKFFLSKEISRTIWVRVGLRNNRLVILQGEWISRRCFFSFGTKAESYPMPSSSRPPALVSGMAEAHQCYTSDLRHRNRFVWRVSCTCYHLLSITSNCVVIYIYINEKDHIQWYITWHTKANIWPLLGIGQGDLWNWP